MSPSAKAARRHPHQLSKSRRTNLIQQTNLQIRIWCSWLRQIWLPSRKGRGMVTAELAFGLCSCVLIACGLFGVVGASLQQIRNDELAWSIARQAARGDQRLVEAAINKAPKDAGVEIKRSADVVIVRVTSQYRPLGETMINITLASQAQVVSEGES